MTKIKYRPEIDGLRALAVLSVVIYHANFILDGERLLSGGYMGVDIFFVISGYLITSIILKGLLTGTFSFAEFYERRARRILPALFTVILVMSPLALTLLIPWQLMDFFKSAFAAIFFFSNIYFWKNSGYFSPDSTEVPLLHTWSLSIEEQFYILFPLFLFLLWRYKRSLIILLFVTGILLSLYVANWYSQFQAESSFYLLPTRMWELLCGAVLAKAETSYGRRPVPRIIQTFLNIIFLAAIMASLVIFDTNTPHPGYMTLFIVIGTMGLIWFLQPDGLITRLLSIKPVVFTGLISYSLYLWHYPLLSFLELSRFDTSLGNKFWIIMISFLLSIVSYHFVEQPIRKNRLNLKKCLVFCSSLTLLLLATTGMVIKTEGGLGRYHPLDLRMLSKGPIELGYYVRYRFLELENRQFDDNDKIKLLLIGDSYAQDLLNAIIESDMISNFSVSTHLMPARCVNLYLHYDISENILPGDRPFCASRRDYHDVGLQELMREADTLWIASSWQDWQIELLPQSIQNIQSVTNARIVVFGSKNFGNNTIDDLINIPVEDRVGYRQNVLDSHLQTNELLKSRINAEYLVDLQMLLCDGLKTCPVFDKDSNVISYDSSHLTKMGAKFVGEKLKSHPLIRELLSDKQIDQQNTQ